MLMERDSISALADAYPAEPTVIRHELTEHNLLALPRLAELAVRLPEAQVEYNHGDLPVAQDPALTPANGLSAEETVRSIHENNSWMVLKNVETDPGYRALLSSCLDPLRSVVAAKTGPMLREEAFIFISSPNSVTPFHMDPEHNILMQVSGEKKVHLYPATSSELVPPEQHETWHENGHRNLLYKPEFDRLARIYDLQPGSGLHIPLKSPHWILNGRDVSISLSVTWRSKASLEEAALHRMNALLRRRGLRPKMAGQNRTLDKGKALLYRALGRAGWLNS